MDTPRGEKFDLLMNAGDELLIVFEANTNTVQTPHFSFDGKETAILYKNETVQPLVFRPVPREAREAMKRAQHLLCVEVSGGKIVNEYYAEKSNEISKSF